MQKPCWRSQCICRNRVGVVSVYAETVSAYSVYMQKSCRRSQCICRHSVSVVSVYGDTVSAWSVYMQKPCRHTVVVDYADTVSQVG